jgi:hypothetical protein
MREILELQTGQVAFISGLMSGFAVSIAAHVLRLGIRSRTAQVVFLLFLSSSLLFLVALYVDVRLSIALVGHDTLPQSLLTDVASVRNLGTSCATLALFLFVLAIGLLGWLATPFAGFTGSLIAAMALYALWYIWQAVNGMGSELSQLP